MAHSFSLTVAKVSETFIKTLDSVFRCLEQSLEERTFRLALYLLGWHDIHCTCPWKLKYEPRVATQAEDHRGSKWQHIKQWYTLLHILPPHLKDQIWQQCGEDVSAVSQRASEAEEPTCKEVFPFKEESVTVYF